MTFVHKPVDLVQVTEYVKALKIYVKSKSGIETVSRVKLLVAVFDKDMVDSFVEQLKCDKLTTFVKNIPEFEDACSWDNIRVEIDFNSALAEFEFINSHDLAKVSSIFPVVYTVQSVYYTIQLCLELLACFTFIRD